MPGETTHIVDGGGKDAVWRVNGAAGVACCPLKVPVVWRLGYQHRSTAAITGSIPRMVNNVHNANPEAFRFPRKCPRHLLEFRGRGPSVGKSKPSQ